MPAIKPLPAHTSAEALARRLSDLGATAYILARPNGQPWLFLKVHRGATAAETAMLVAMIHRRNELARHVEDRFDTDPLFRKSLFVWLSSQGRVHPLFTQAHPGRIVLDAPAAAAS